MKAILRGIQESALLYLAIRVMEPLVCIVIGYLLGKVI